MTITRRLLNALLSAVAAGLIASLAAAGVGGCMDAAPPIRRHDAATPPSPRTLPCTWDAAASAS